MNIVKLCQFLLIQLLEYLSVLSIYVLLTFFTFFSGGLERWKMEKFLHLNYDIRLLPLSNAYNTESEEQTGEVNAGMKPSTSSGITPILDPFSRLRKLLNCF